MTSEQLVEEIAILDKQIEQLKHDIILADGARQAFRYMLDREVPAEVAEVAEVAP